MSETQLNSSNNTFSVVYVQNFSLVTLIFHMNSPPPPFFSFSFTGAWQIVDSWVTFSTAKMKPHTGTRPVRPFTCCPVDLQHAGPCIFRIAQSFTQTVTTRWHCCLGHQVQRDFITSLLTYFAVVRFISTRLCWKCNNCFCYIKVSFVNH